MRLILQRADYCSVNRAWISDRNNIRFAPPFRTFGMLVSYSRKQPFVAFPTKVMNGEERTFVAVRTKIVDFHSELCRVFTEK